ncbi:MAG TPA: sigma-70 family RNA polymerase sigma factor [Actinomycetota bacterium]|nr:sigma-70 family RNA polymerase sigma factor [Actinomycetota bacterium]
MRRPKGSRSTAPRELVTPELVERCKAGDEASWAELVEATHREVYTLCLRILRDPDDAAEATQDTYLKAWRALKGFRGEAMFTTWLYRVAANTAISKHRSRKRRRTHESGVGDEVLGQIAAGGSTESSAGARLEVQDLERALQVLPDHYRSAVVLRDVYGLSIEEVAGQLKISETAAKVRIHRGRKKLKQLLYPETQREEV